jgi:Dfp1/Him1, central region/DBF zinc finger
LLGIDAGSPTKPSDLKPKPLEHLLRAEAKSGITSERDPQTLRNDYHYFAPKSRYVLVEDSSSEHRPILHQQYSSPDEYPTLYGGVEGKSAFVCGERPPRPPPPLPPAQRALAKAGGYNALCLRKSLSHTQLQKRYADEKAEGEGFLAASGNSVTITSNIASGTTSARSGAAALTRPSSALAAALSKKTLVTLKGGAAESHDANKLKRAVSVETGLNRKDDAPCRPKKPGYCENCRIKYDDFNIVRERPSAPLFPFVMAYAVLIETPCLSSTLFREDIDVSRSILKTGSRSTTFSPPRSGKCAGTCGKLFANNQRPQSCPTGSTYRTRPPFLAGRRRRLGIKTPWEARQKSRVG